MEKTTKSDLMKHALKSANFKVGEEKSCERMTAFFEVIIKLNCSNPFFGSKI